MSNTNLLAETVKFMAEHGKNSDDVLWVGFDDTFYCSWSEFVDAAKNLDYYAGFGGNEVDGALKIVGADWWMERGEYDGSEWWEFKTLPTQHKRLQRTPVEKDLRSD